MTIKHLVISGGGPSGMYVYGAIRNLSIKKFWNINDIKSIYGCSIGGLISVLVSLKYDWELLDDYIIKRPWEKVVVKYIKNIFDVYHNKGICGENEIDEFVSPLLTAKGLDKNITLLELYDYNKIDIHLYTTNINKKNLEKIDLSFKTHPDLKVITALSMTMAYPILFKPVFYENECFIDGGILNNLPINDCLFNNKCEKNEILAFKNKWINKKKITTIESSPYDYLLNLSEKLFLNIDTEDKQENIDNIMICQIDEFNNINSWLDILTDRNVRINAINKGMNQSELFLSYHNFLPP